MFRVLIVDDSPIMRGTVCSLLTLWNPHVEIFEARNGAEGVGSAIVDNPNLILMDEPTSALDVSVQAQIVDLLREVQAKYDLVYLFISHDLKVVRALAHYLVVMKNGKMIEQGEAGQVLDNPKEAYTKELMDAAFSPLG